MHIYVHIYMNMSERRSRKKKHSHKATSTRVKYDPSTGDVENPSANYDSDLIEKALEKIIKQVSDMSASLEKMEERIASMDKKVKKLKDIPARVTVLEADMQEVSRKISGMSYNLETTSYNTQAEEHLRDYMMEEKDRDATDTMMSGNEIGSKMEAMKAKRRLHQMQ